MRRFPLRINLLLLLPVLSDHPSWMRWYIITCWFLLAEGTTEASLEEAMLCPHFAQNHHRNATRRLIVNTCGVKVLPQQFRSSSQPLEYYLKKYERHFGPVKQLPSMEGYEETRMFGSSQFRPSQLQRLAKFWRDRRLIVVDLRMESHGFLDDVAVSYFCPKNWDLLMVTDVEELQSVEFNDFDRLNGSTLAVIFDKDRDDVTTSKQIQFGHPRTERQVVESLGLEYRRIHIPDHRRPRDSEVEQLVELFVDNPDVEMYFHCKAGKGRTTTAMIMRDIYLNAHRVSFADILERNCIYSRYHVVFQIEKNQGTYREVEARRRFRFFQLFYEYIKEQHKGNLMSWTEWIRNREGQGIVLRYATFLVSYLVDQAIKMAHLVEGQPELLIP